MGLWEQIPLTPSGKLDRKSLPDPEDKDITRNQYEPPRGLVEEKLAGIWQEVLGVDNISIHDNFFDIGGHSLKILSLHSLIEEEFPDRISIAKLFTYSTITSQAEYIGRKHKGGDRNKKITDDELDEIYNDFEKGKLSADKAAEKIMNA